MAALLFNSLSSVYETLHWLLFRIKISIPAISSAVHHEIVTSARVSDRVVLIVGDVHGCYDELLDLIAAGKELTNDQELYFVFAGDMLNKGPKNKEVLDYIRDLMDRGLASAVKGNHEEAILRQWRMLCRDKDYDLPKRYQYLNEFNDDDFAFIERLPYSVSLPHLNAIIVHAGLVPGIPLRRQSNEDLCQMRNVEITISIPLGRRATAHTKPTSGVAWATLWQGPEHVYFGHDCRRGLQQLPFATGLDTGCVYGGELTGVLLGCTKGDSPKLLSVSAKCVHYPGKRQLLLEEQNSGNTS